MFVSGYHNGLLAIWLNLSGSCKLLVYDFGLFCPDLDPAFGPKISKFCPDRTTACQRIFRGPPLSLSLSRPLSSMFFFGTTLILSNQQLQCSRGTSLRLERLIHHMTILGNRLAPQLGADVLVRNCPRRLSLSIARQCTPTRSTLYHHLSIFRLLIRVIPSRSTFPEAYFFHSDMSQPSSSSFNGLFNAALKDYANQTKTKLDQHPLAKKLEACDSVDSITAILQEQAQIFKGFRGDDGKIMKSLRSSVDVLYTLSNSTILGQVIGLVVRTTLSIMGSCS